jgi:iron-sulfur cluster assembly protein
MLVLTEAAATVVMSVTSTPQIPARARLRISSSGPQPRDATSLQVSATASPAEHDQIIEADEARTFLEPQAAVYLEDKVLDAQVDEQGNVSFSLGKQGSGSPES